MASPLLLVAAVVLVAISSVNLSMSELTETYYEKTCPNFEKILTDVINAKQTAVPRTMGSTFRILFHDCMVDGCDASLLLKSSSAEGENTELKIDFNDSLSPEGFELINAAKEALEAACPGVVSCSDIIAYSTRNLIELAGGPHFKVPLGRKDGTISCKSHVEGNLPRANATMDEMIRQFTQYGMTMEDLVALTIGGHTAGSSHCKSFGRRFFGYNATTKTDPSVDPEYAQSVINQCKGPWDRIQIDETTPYKIDSVYCNQIQKNRVVFTTDSLFVKDPRTSVIIEQYAKDEKAFFDAFVKGMEKLVMIGIKDETNGQVRRRCDSVN